jgi:hypothetical protein
MAAKTPRGTVSLKELIESLQKEGKEIPEDVKKLMGEEPKKESPQSTNPPDEKNTNEARIEIKTAAPSNQNTKKFTYNFVRILLGKSAAEKLIKKTLEPTAENTENTSNIKDIKSDIEDIKDHLASAAQEDKKVPLGESTNKRRGKHSAIKPSIGKRFFAAALDESVFGKQLGWKYDPYNRKRKTTQKLSSRVRSHILKTHKLTDKLTPVKAHNQAAELARNVAPDNQSQKEVFYENEIHEKNKNQEAINKKLEEILKKTKKLSENHDSLSNLIPLLMGAIAEIAGKFAPLFRIIGSIASEVGEFIANFASKVKQAVVDAWDWLKGVGSKIKQGAEDAWDDTKSAAEDVGDFFKKSYSKIKGKIEDSLPDAEDSAGGILEDTGVGLGDIAGAPAAALGGGLYAGDKITKSLEQGKKRGLVAHTAKALADAGSVNQYGMVPGMMAPVSPAPKGVAPWQPPKKKKINRVPAKSAIHENISRASQPLKNKNLVPAKNKMHEALRAASEVHSQNQSEPKVVVMKGGNRTTVIPATKNSEPLKNIPTMLLTARNGEPSINRLQSVLWNDTAGYASITRI